MDITAYLEGDYENALLTADIPERMHRRYMACNTVDIEIEEEWILNKMTPKKRKSPPKSRAEESPVSREEIRKILHMLRIQNFEVFDASEFLLKSFEFGLGYVYIYVSEVATEF